MYTNSAVYIVPTDFVDTLCLYIKSKRSSKTAKAKRISLASRVHTTYIYPKITERKKTL